MNTIQFGLNQFSKIDLKSDPISAVFINENTHSKLLDYFYDFHFFF